MKTPTVRLLTGARDVVLASRYTASEMRRSDPVRTLQATVRWYLDHYHGKPHDNGGPAMFCDRGRLGHFAAPARAFSAGRSRPLFKLLIASTLFQRRQDQQVFRILKSLDRAQVEALTNDRELLRRALSSRCSVLHSSATLHEDCDLRKRTGANEGFCRSATCCPPKTHTILLRRYADFGKVPSSAALMLHEDGVRGLAGLYGRVLRSGTCTTARAIELEMRLMRAWRVSDKIAAMFLSALSNPDLGGPHPPWTEGIDWTRFVVIDSNVDYFLADLGFSATHSYGARRQLIFELARKVPLSSMRHGLSAFNPRIIQQAMYVFRSRTNRRANPLDCMHLGRTACKRCDAVLVRLCPVSCAEQSAHVRGGPTQLPS